MTVCVCCNFIRMFSASVNGIMEESHASPSGSEKTAETELKQTHSNNKSFLFY